MKRGLILFFVLIFLVMNVFGLSVELVSPVNNAVYVDSNTVVFKCKATGDDLRFLELYTSVNGWGKKAEVSNPASSTDVVFSVKNVSNGDFIWNCKAIDGLEGIKFSASNRSFSVNLAPNNAPTYKGGLSSQSWNMNTDKRNAFDLDDYFSDVENDRLSYSVSGNDNIIVNIDMNGLVGFSPPANWFGTERVYFSASDGKSSANSDVVNLTVIKTSTSPSTPPGSGSAINTAPTIEKIPDQNVSLDSGSWYLDLANYGKDNEEASSKLNWFVDGVNNDLLKVEIDNVLKRARFTSQGKIGTDTITFTVSDSGGLNASQSLRVVISDKKSSETGNLIKEVGKSDSSEPGFFIKAVVPAEKTVFLKVNEIEFFKLETSRKGDMEWYLDGQLLGETKSVFSFNSQEEGEYNLTVYASDLDESVSNSWKVIVRKEETNIVTSTDVQPAVQPVCGNNITEENENCSNCPSDVKCLEGQNCEEGICAEKKGFFSFFSEGLNGITGGFVTDLNGDILKTTGYGVLGVLVVLSVSVLIIRARNKRKYTRLTRLEEEEGFVKSVQGKLRELYLKRREKREQKLTLKNLESRNKEEILKVAPSSLAIAVSFIKESITSGHSRSVIKKALREKGWSRLQIWKAFRKT